MKANPLVLAVLVLAVVGGLVYYTNKNPPKPESDTVAIIDAKDADIKQVTIDKPGGESITVVRGDDDKWRFGGGIDVPADDSAIGLMITNLASMNADRVVEDETKDWAPYGLEGAGTLEVTMTPKEGEPKTVIFGKATPTGSNLFARLEGDPRLFTVYNYVKSSFDKSVFDWRDKKLLHIDADKISRLTVDVDSKSFEFGKAGEQNWQILKPKPLRADNFSVGDLARSIENAEMIKVVRRRRRSQAGRVQQAIRHGQSRRRCGRAYADRRQVRRRLPGAQFRSSRRLRSLVDAGGRPEQEPRRLPQQEAGRLRLQRAQKGRGQRRRRQGDRREAGRQVGALLGRRSRA